MLRAVFASALLAIAVGALAWAGPEQQPLLGVGGASAGGGGYTGPGDVQPAKWYYALRAYTSATRGNKLVNVCTTISTVDTCADMFSDATTGALVITTIGGAACNTSTQPYNIKTWYDLTGNGLDQTDTNPANRAVLTTCNGATTGAAFSGGQGYNAIASATQAQPFEVIWAGTRTGAFTTQGNVFDTNGGIPQDGYWTSTNTVYGYTGTIQTATASDSACHIMQIIHNGASGSIRVDNGAPATLDMGASGISAFIPAIGGEGTSRFITGTLFEVGVVASGSPTSLYSNIHGYGNC